jgi:hypothetical protein
LLEGYTAAGPLTSAENERRERLGLLLEVAETLVAGGDVALARLPEQIATALSTLGSPPG